jgi:hypothetical protein
VLCSTLMKAFSFAVAALLSLLTAPAVAQTDNDCLVRTVYVHVNGKHWQTLTHLTKNNFKGEFHHAPVEIQSVTPMAMPRHLAILLDVSGSMRPRDEITALFLSLAGQMALAAPPDTEVGLYTFAEDIQERVPYTKSHETVLKQLQQLNIGAYPEKKATALLDSIYKVIVGMDHVGPGDVIYLIADGGDNRSNHTARDVKRLLLSTGVRVFCVIMVTQRSPADRVFAAELVEQFTHVSGGDTFRVEPDDDLMSLMQPKAGPPLAINLMALAVDNYRLQIKLPQTPDKPQSWKLELTDLAPEIKEHFKVVYPIELGPCTNRQPSATTENSSAAVK